MTRILVIDNFDSFVYTLNGYLQQLGAHTAVVRNNVILGKDAEDVLAKYDGVLISPGPGTPSDAGVSIEMVRAALNTKIPLLGVCLGHQAIAEAFGATVTHAEELMHGKTSQVVHDSSDFYAGVPSPFRATRYHSLAVVRSTVPDSLSVNSETESGVVMGLRHHDAEIYGVQFHPESVLTEGGYNMLGNWLERAGLSGASERAQSLSPLLSGVS
ncbi:gamma-glutamyl-gamma-aminobutyrate hydrolase family protein [Lysinibacter sp. HNR]|uniref:anthranilate synthase component II n=1 Tax=Lysinibacter sp. HNR TaxID=3031408 RepID=UPI0024359F10|nr:gamma-glutamyl-gamma-aminobutyrate hydrolase family protein [Lysinibacter sp. HNR]WGD37359.1 gamma-glutamyl-gamma-aminobutyrate hydrolase family protein [Lysinibacter sp. HNR]